MQFTQIEFLIVFSVVLLWVNIVHNNTLKKIVLLLSSGYFYIYTDYRCYLLLLFATLLTYCGGKLIQGSESFVFRRLLCFFAISVNVLILVIFKYYNFFIEQMAVFGSHGGGVPGGLDLVIPLGVSFYTFRFISYLVDIFRNDIRSGELFDFLIYGTFFPIIISGPIARAGSFLPQLTNIKTSRQTLFAGYRLFVVGLFLKIFVADRLAGFVSFFFENYNIFDCFTSWLGVLAYSVQIYCDFAGYSSMALGLAMMVGIEIEDNFNFPYLAVSMTDFWKRWHITLSLWIRDYLYIPLGGSRKGSYRKYINLFVAMAICGLWHGAAWTFVFWGMFHGILLIINHIWRGTKFQKNLLILPRCYLLASWLVTFFCVTIGWVIFRSDNMTQAAEITVKLFSFTAEGFAWPQPFVISILLATFIFHVLVYFKFKVVSLPVNSAITPTLLFCCLWLVIVFYPSTFQPFVYAQF